MVATCRSTHVFGEDLVQGVGEELPVKDLDVLFDLSRFGVGKVHDALEEGLETGARL